MNPALKRMLILIFLSISTILCFVANRVTSDNMYNPVLDEATVSVRPTSIEEVDKSSDIFYFEFDDLNEKNNTLLFYTNHQEVFVKADGELIYSLEESDSIFARTPGAMWNVVTIPVDAEEVSVYITQTYPNLAKQEVVFERGSVINMYHKVIDDSLIELALATAIIIIGMALTAYWALVLKKMKDHREVFYLGLFAIIFGIWNLGETQFVVFLFDNRPFWSYLAFTCLMTMCLPALHFFRDFLEVEDKNIHRIISVYIVAETVICQVLHLTGIAGVKETANYTIVSIVLILLYLIYAIISGVVARKSIKKIAVNIIGLSLLVVTAVMDMSTYFTDIASANKVAKVGFLIYAILLGLESTRVARERLQEAQKMEIIKEMAVKDMLTGCFNRNAYNDDISNIGNLTGMQVIGFDLNDLKKCNDTKGHKAGDEYIQEAARMICSVFGDYGKVYRIGGDEFCILTRGIPEKQLEQRKVKLQVSIAHYVLDHPDSGFGIACGYATYDPEVDKSIEDTRHRSDVSMYENKKEIKA